MKFGALGSKSSQEVFVQESRVGLVTFSRGPRLHFALDAFDNKEDVKRRILATDYVSGSTQTESVRTIYDSVV